MSEILEILMQGSLDKSSESINRLKRDAQEIEEKLKGEKVTLQVGLDEGVLKNLEKEMRGVSEAVNNLVQNINFDKIKEEFKNTTAQATEFESGMRNIKKQADLLSQTTKMDFMSDTVSSIKESQKDLLTVQKIINTFTEDGTKLVDIVEQRVDYAKVQKELYSDLTKSLAKINSLETQKLQASEKNQAIIDKELKGHYDTVKEISKTLDMYDLRNDKMEREVKTAQKLKEIQQSIREEKDKDSQSRKAYSELVKLAKEEGQISKQMIGSQGEVNALYQDRLNTVRALMAEVGKQVVSEGLHDSERELILKREIQKITAETEVAEQKSLDKEDLRIARLNERLATLQDLANTTEKIEISGNKEELEELVMGMDEFFDSTYKGNTKILSYNQALDNAGNAQAKMTVQTRESNGMVKEHRVVVDEATQSVYKLSERTKEASNRSLGFVESLKVAIQRTLQWGLSTKLIGESFRFVRNAVSHVLELNKELVQISIVTGMTREETEALGRSYVDLGLKMGKTVKEISAVNTDLIRQGLSTEESLKRMQTTLKLSATSGMDTKHALSIITSGVNALGEEAEKLSDVLVHAGNISASSADQVGDALTRVASSAKSTGTSLEQVTALTATLIEVTQESPSSLGNSLKTLMARFNKVNAETGEFNESINDTQVAFERAGVAFTDGAGQIKPFYELLTDLSVVWEDLDNNTKNYIATASAGANQRNRFLAIMENFNRVQGIHNDLLDAEGTLTEGYGKYLDSAEASMSRFKTTMEGVWQDFVDSGTLKDIIDLGTALVELLTKTRLWGGNLAQVGIIMLAVKGRVKGLAKVVNENLGQAFKDSELSGLSLKETIEKAGGATNFFKGVLKSVSVAIKGTKSSTEGAETAMKGFNWTLVTAELSVVALQVALSWGLSIALNVVMKGLQALIGHLAKSREELSSLKDEVESNISSYEKNIRTLKSMNEEFEELQKKVHGYAGGLKLTSEEQDKYNQLASQIAEIAPEVVQGYDEKGNAVIEYSTNLDKLIEKEELLIELEKKKILDNKGHYQTEFGMEKDRAQYRISNLQKKIDKIKDDIATAENVYENKASKGLDGTAEIESIEKKKQALTELLSEQKAYQAQIEEARQTYSVVTDMQMKEIEGIEGISKALVSLIDTRARAMLLEDQGTVKSEKFISSMKTSIESYKSSIEGLSFEEAITQSKEFLNSLEELGVPRDEAEGMLYELADSAGLFGEKLEATELAITLNTESLKAYNSELDKLSGIYRKIAQGQNLTATETMDLIMEYDELADIVLETGELSIEHLENLEEVMGKVTDARTADLRAKQKDNEMQVDLAKIEVQRLENSIKLMDSVGATSGKHYENLKDQLNGQIKLIESLETANKKASKQIQAISLMQDKAFNTQKVEDYQSVIKATSGTIDDLKGIIEDLNEHGFVSQEVAQKIIEQYPELMFYLDNEALLREKIIEKIRETTETQDEHYRSMLMMTDGFATAFYNKHSSLIGEVADIYGVDVENFKSATNAKLAMMNAFNASFTQQGKELAKSFGGGTKGDIELLRKLKWQKIAGVPDITQTKEKQGNYSPEQLKMTVSQIDNTIKLLEAELAFADTFKVPELSQYKSVGGSSSKKKPSKKGSKTGTKQVIEEVELLTDRYKKFEKALREVSRTMELTDGLMELSSGEDRIKLIEKTNNLIREQQRLLSLQAKEARKERAELEKSLTKGGIKVSDGTFGLDSFAKYSKDTENAINSIVRQINKTSNDSVRENLTKQKDEMQKTYDKIKEDFDTYIELRESIPDMSAEWWILEYEALSKTLEAIDFRYESYDEKIDYLNDSLSYMLSIREDNVEELKREEEVLQAIGDLHKEALKDIEIQMVSSVNRVKDLERELVALGDTRNEQYEQVSRRLVLARAEQDKYFEHYRGQLNALASQQSAIIDRYMADLNRAKDETLKAIEDIRISFDGFDRNSFTMSVEKIIHELNTIDGIFKEGAKPNLDTSEARREIEYWRESILDTVSELRHLEKDIEYIFRQQTNSKEEAIEKQEKLTEMLEEQVEKENALKLLEKEIKEEILEMELNHKKIEDSLQNQIDLRQEELKQLQEKYAYEDRIRALKEKQLELMRTMDDTRFSYITGKGEEVFSYDQEKVLSLQKELAGMQRKEEEEEEISKISKDITRLQDELAKTREINQQELEVLKLAQKGISELIGVVGKGIDQTKQDIELAYEKTGDLFADEIKAEMKKFTDFYQDYWDTKMDRVVADIISDNREINKGKLGGKEGEKFGTHDKNNTSQAPPKKPNVSGGGSGNSSALTVYTIKAGDTLQSVAEKFNTTVSDLEMLNSYVKGRTELPVDGRLVVPDRFDTGGYTGDWGGSTPRVALVDQKELILKPSDTENILKAVNVTREISSLFSSGISGSLSKEEGKAPIVLNNPNFNEIHNSKDFANELMDWSRKGMPKIN